MKVPTLFLSILSTANSNQLFKVPLPENIEDSVNDAMKPLLDFMEPFKVGSYNVERGVPEVHPPLSK